MHPPQIFLLFGGQENFEFLRPHKCGEINSTESLARGIPPVTKCAVNSTLIGQLKLEKP